jgi:alpha-glucosidase (family GH31 glycosyl hydrolase)
MKFSCILILFVALVSMDIYAYDDREYGVIGVMLDDGESLSLHKFYRIGGENLPASPTECLMRYSDDTLFVSFRCKENNLSFPAIVPHEDWFNLYGSPVEQDAVFPDKVDFFLMPAPGIVDYYHFAVTIDGLKFGCHINGQLTMQDADGQIPKKKNTKIFDFKADCFKQEGEWNVFLRIPWKTVGGKPEGYFGLLPVRTKWRSSEVSAPAGMAFSDRPATDLFIEACLGKKAAIRTSGESLCRLPSGKFRWQWPVMTTYPDIRIKKAIWQLQCSVKNPTTEKNLPKRLHLLREWVGLMESEGFNFGSTRGGLPEKDMYLSQLRNNVNMELWKGNISQACRIVDEYLERLDAVSSKWYADGSPGNILSEEWMSVKGLTAVELKDSMAVLYCKTDARSVSLYVSMPESGGIRLHSDREGFFKPQRLGRIESVEIKPGCYELSCNDAKILIHNNPFSLSFRDSSGNLKLHVNGKDIAFRFNKEGRILAADMKITMTEDETVFGFGEKFDRFDQHQNVLTLWGMDDWMGLTAGLQNQSYKPIPIFHSSKGYMLFYNSTYRLRADVGATERGRLRLTQHGNIFDFYVWTSRPDMSLSSYTALTGRPVLPPKWAFEPWMGRTGRGWKNTPLNDPVAEMRRVIDKYDELGVRHSAIYAEGAGAESPELHKYLYSRNIKALSWFYSAVPLKKQIELMPEVDVDDLPFLKVDNPLQLASKAIDYVDFTHPNAKELSRRWWKLRLDLGVAGSMVDFGDRVPEDVLFYNGKTGAEMHNFYAYDYHRTYSEVFSERRGNDFILFGRSAAPGTQKYAAQFPGDLRANFSGLKGGLNGLLSLSSCGFSTWGSDLGGFRAWPEPLVYIRWTQFACFSPLMRQHGRVPSEPWEYGDSAVGNYVKYAWVRENLLDYIYLSAREAHQSGIPIVRPMAIAFPEQTSIAKIDDQYMFGKYLMVCPVLTDDYAREITFPHGKWISLWDGMSVCGQSVHKTEAPADVIPVYIRENAIIPVTLSGDFQFGKSMTKDRVHAVIVTVSDSTREEILIDHLPETRYVLIYGVLPKSIGVNGHLLNRLTGNEFKDCPPGWFHDISGNRCIVRLPHNTRQKVILTLK